MKKLVTLILTFLILTPALLFANVAQVLPKSSFAKDDHALLVLVSKEAHIAANKSGTYKLTLKGVNPKVIYFLDRPERQTGQISLNKFVTQWDKGKTFNQDAPNAVMEAVRLDAKTKKLENAESTYAVTLYNPSVNKNELSFEIKPLPGNSTTLPTMASSDYVAIFIDDVCLSCIG